MLSWSECAEHGYTMALRVLARGLEMNRSSGKIWCMYLHLYAHKPASASGRDQSSTCLAFVFRLIDAKCLLWLCYNHIVSNAIVFP